MTAANPAAHRIYLRISRPDEAAILENQRASAMRYSESIGGGLAQVYEDTASGADAEREGLGALMRDVRRGEIVVFTSLSRMTRGGTGAALDILRQLEARGAGWHFVDQPILNWDSTTPKVVKDILLAVFAAIDEDYRRNISEKVKASFARRRALDPDWRGPGRPRKEAPP